MKKNARSTEVKTSALDQRPKNTTSRNELSLSNPRHVRGLVELLRRAITREALDKAVGCSNGPDLVAQLRRKGLEIPCTMIPDTDRDGLPIRRGVYHLTDKDRRKVLAMNRQRGFVAPHLLGLLTVAVPVVVVLGAVVAGWLS